MKLCKRLLDKPNHELWGPSSIKCANGYLTTPKTRSCATAELMPPKLKELETSEVMSEPASDGIKMKINETWSEAV